MEVSLGAHQRMGARQWRSCRSRHRCSSFLTQRWTLQRPREDQVKTLVSIMSGLSLQVRPNSLAQRILLPHKWAILETLTKSPNTKIAMRKFPSRPVVAVSLVRSAKVRSLRPGHSYNACSRLRGRLAKTARLMTMSLWRRIERWTSGKRSSSNSSTSSW